MAIFRKRLQQDLDHDDAGQRLAHVARRADHYRNLVATPSVLMAAGLFSVSGFAGGYLATGQSVPRAIATTTQPAPVAASQPVALPQAAPASVAEVEVGAEVGAEVLPPVLEAALTMEPAPVEEEEVVYTSLSVDAATGRAERANPRPVLSEAQAEMCRSNLQRAADRLSVRFSHGSQDALAEDMDAAFSFAEGVASCTDIRVMVRGHADATGDETQNLLLSWERAESVIEAIASAGHDTSIYEPVGYGSRQLLDDAPADQAEALNRRVEFAVVPRLQ